MPCPFQPWYGRSAGYYECILPNFDFDPTTAYDVFVYSDAGNVTLPGLVSYTGAPTLVSIDDCIDRGDMYKLWGLGVQCPVGTTITLHGSRFPSDTAVAVQFDTRWPYAGSVNLTSPTVINTSTITATLSALEGAAAGSYGSYGTVRVVFTSADTVTMTNSLQNGVYGAINAPVIKSITSNKCDSVSALQLTNCRALATITVTGDNLARRDELMLATSAGGMFQGYNYLSPPLDTNSTWFDSSSNTSLVYTLSYFDANTNVRMQPDTVYTMFIVASSGYQWDVSNAFRLSLTYGTARPATGSSKLSSGAIAGIVVGAVVVAVLLLLVVVWLARRMLWSTKSAGGGLQWSTHTDAQSSEEYKDVELH